MFLLNYINLIYLLLFNGINFIYPVSCQTYFISQEAVNWYQALINCNSLGMELLSIHTVEENRKLEKYLYDNESEGGYWLAGTREGDGQYYWATTGTKVVYTHWLKGQPNNYKFPPNNMEGEQCIQWGMGDNNPKPVGWNDLACQTFLRYICQEPDYCNNNNYYLI